MPYIRERAEQTTLMTKPIKQQPQRVLHVQETPVLCSQISTRGTRNTKHAALYFQDRDVYHVFCQEGRELMWLIAWWLLCYLHGQATLALRLFCLCLAMYSDSFPEILNRNIVCLVPRLICKLIFMEDVTCTLWEFRCSHLLTLLYTWDWVSYHQEIVCA